MTAQVTMLTDEEIAKKAASRLVPHENLAFAAGARFARDRYEAREKL